MKTKLYIRILFGVLTVAFLGQSTIRIFIPEFSIEKSIKKIPIEDSDSQHNLCAHSLSSTSLVSFLKTDLLPIQPNYIFLEFPLIIKNSIHQQLFVLQYLETLFTIFISPNAP